MAKSDSLNQCPQNEYICRLEARVSALEASGQRKSKGCSEDDVRQLERQCQALQKQVDEMEVCCIM